MKISGERLSFHNWFILVAKQFEFQDMRENILSLLFSVIESYDDTCKNTLALTSNVIDNVRVNNAFLLK